MILGRLRRHGSEPQVPVAEQETVLELDTSELSRVFSAPRWLRDLGLLAWFLVGVAAVLVGLTWLLGITETIVAPVIVGTVVAAVASPLVSMMQRHRIPRAAGAGLVLLGFVVIAVVIAGLVLGGISSHSDEIRASMTKALDKLQTYFEDAGASGTGGAKQDVANAVPTIGKTLLQGVAQGIRGLTSLAFFLSFMFLTLFFMLKDGPRARTWINGHLGVPTSVASVITGTTITSLRRYFLGVTFVAAFNGLVVAIGALILGVPLAATIGIVTFVTAYVPYVGAFVAGAFAVLLALGAKGAATALIMLVIVILANGLLQNIFQPIAFGATLQLHPLIVLVVTISAGCLFGMVGLVLAAPLTSAAVHVNGQLARARAAQAVEEADAPPDAAPEPAPG